MATVIKVNLDLNNKKSTNRRVLNIREKHGTKIRITCISTNKGNSESRLKESKVFDNPIIPIIKLMHNHKGIIFFKTYISSPFTAYINYLYHQL